MPVSEQCLREFRDVFEASRWALVGREALRRGYSESAAQAINFLEYHLKKMKGTLNTTRLKKFWAISRLRR